MSQAAAPSAFSLEGKTVLVTGASSGIGRQIALSVAQAGAAVIASGRDEARLAALLAELDNPSHRVVRADLSNDEAIKGLAEQAGKIDGVVHSAGVSALAPVRLATRSHVQSQLDLNYTGPLLLTQQLLLRNALTPGGSIVFISSISAHIGVQGVAAYGASKAALEGMARVLALEVAKKKIRVNCLAPGLVETPMLAAARSTTGGLEETLAKYPLGVGLPEDVANAVIYFLSVASRWVTGTTLVLDGGHTIG